MMITRKILISLFLFVAWHTQAQWAYVADYLIPAAAETGREAVNSFVKSTICTGSTSSIVQFTCSWLQGFNELQKNNLQNGLSKHLQEKIAANSQSFYNDLFPPTRSENAFGFQKSMAALRSAELQAQSTESLKSRSLMGQWLPIFDSLFALAAKEDTSDEMTARVLAYTVFLFVIFLPEYRADDLQLSLKPRNIFKTKLLDFEEVTKH